MDDDDSDLGDLLTDLLESNENPQPESPKPEPSKPENTLKELGYNFLETASNSIETSSPKKVTSLIDDENLDSSDDEDKRNFEQQNYSEGGREIKNFLKKVESEKKDKIITREVLGESKPTFDFNNAKGFSSQSSNVGRSNKFQPSANSASASKNPSSSDVYSDPIFGLRITNPLISSTELTARMTDKSAVPLSKVKNFLVTSNLKEDWVIAGIVIHKSNTLKSQKGSAYCILKLSDLSFDMNTVSLFLFSGAFKGLWKLATGTIIGVLNPNVLDSKDDKEQAALSVFNAQNVMILGTSRDMGTCKSTTKNGTPCTSIVNRSRCEYCVYHVQKEYKQFSRRADIQSSANGRGLKPFANGKNFGPKKVNPAITQSQAQNFFGIPAKQNKKLYEKDRERLAFLTGAKKVEKKEVINLESEKKDDKKLVVSENGDKIEVKKDICRLNKLKESEEKSEVTESTGKKVISESSTSTKKGGFSLSNLQELNTQESTSILSKTPGFSRSKLQEWTMKQGFGNSQPSESPSQSLNLNCLSKSSNSKSPKLLSRSISVSKSLDSPLNPTLSVPRIGNGITSGFIDFSEPITKKQTESAKLNALKWVREKGGIKKSNPNKILLSKEKKEQGLKRKREQVDEDKEVEDKKLKGKKLSEKFKEMMAATSSHTNLIEQADEEEKEKYFGKLEIKEKMEEKMMTTFKIDCKAVRCSICKYTAFSRSDMCKDLNHRVKVIDTVKRFFKCGDCGNRTVSLEKIPMLSCNKCSSSNWKRAAMMDEKKTNIPGATLSIRGGEEKYIGSCVSDANLNLLVPE